jgi:hypothetical protein
MDDGYDWDKLGVQLKKERPKLFSVRLEDYQLGVEWFKRFLQRRFGFYTELVELDAPIGLWRFRDAGEGVVNITHDLVERAEVALQAIEDHERMKSYMEDSWRQP